MSLVTFCDTADRAYGVKTTMAALEAGGCLPSPKGMDVFIKPNFNTADPAPASTHNETLLSMIDQLWERGAKSITLGERLLPHHRPVHAGQGHPARPGKARGDGDQFR